AQTLLRSYRVLAGKRVLIAGNGPLNFQVALELARAGAEIAAVVELAGSPSSRDLRSLGAMLASTPVLALRGAGYLIELRRRGIPVLSGRVLAEIGSNEGRISTLVRGWP